MSGIAITNGNFEAEVLQSSIPVLLDFWSPSCGPCKMMSFVLNELAEKYAGTIKIAKVNTDEETALAEQHRISSVPALVVYKNGEILRKRIGALPKAQLEDLFKDLLKSPAD